MKKTVSHIVEEGFSPSHIYKLLRSIKEDGPEAKKKKSAPKLMVRTKSYKVWHENTGKCDEQYLLLSMKETDTPIHQVATTHIVVA